ncbi:MAG: 3-isopropylmalate dehydratase small subunit [Desulfatiglans sp.]|jgi:3-isopropylmalate/(R)-2-methylmalate dehydratase small subunit|nr:3-isopropylmalate dehydratase small subunit [Desulfatiglans sp.]
MNIKGKVWKFGDNIDTDVIIPARFLNVSDKDILAKNCFADLRPEFGCSVVKGDVIVGGSNFGCGSSREHAPLAIKAAGIGVIVAKSFARIFYRNAFNIGLPILESKEAVEAIMDGDTVSVDLISGEITNVNKGVKYQASPIPDFMRAIIDAGGLVEYVKKQ